MSPLLVGLAIAGLGVPELLIILAVVLLLFGGTKLAGLGKSTGRALREFKEETKGLTDKDEAAAHGDDQEAIDAELVEGEHPDTTQHPAQEHVTHHSEPRRDA